ncbi:hypothetical protein C8J56DRAFT_956373 [Mycena floridula]|nr:hypothetical protein C8J56DRAFT_956373 [Mycena floridula]
MTGKTVRFAQVDRAYSVASSEDTPSPAFSGSTLSSSPSPRTPPSLLPDSSYRSLPPKDFFPGSVAVHDILGPAMASRFNYDVSLDPAHTLYDSPLLTSRVLREAATSPPLPQIFVVSRYLPWKLSILPSSRSPGAFVTVGDVLGGLHCALRIKVTDKEYELSPQALVKEAFEKRWGRILPIDPQAAKVERSKGKKRIDFLMGQNRFNGLSTTDRPNELRLSVKR